MTEDDGLLLNLPSHSDGYEGVDREKKDRKSKVKYPPNFLSDPPESKSKFLNLPSLGNTIFHMNRAQFK